MAITGPTLESVSFLCRQAKSQAASGAPSVSGTLHQSVPQSVRVTLPWRSETHLYNSYGKWLNKIVQTWELPRTGTIWITSHIVFLCFSVIFCQHILRSLRQGPQPNLSWTSGPNIFRANCDAGVLNLKIALVIATAKDAFFELTLNNQPLKTLESWTPNGLTWPRHPSSFTERFRPTDLKRL